jgi:hypothetical protein
VESPELGVMLRGVGREKMPVVPSILALRMPPVAPRADMKLSQCHVK